jgi:drug/metabolite transporter (DMT)-like permease
MLTVNRVLGAILVVIGVALLVRTASLGGGQVGYLAGAVFVALGMLRLRAAR